MWAAPTTFIDFSAIRHPWLDGCSISKPGFYSQFGLLYSSKPAMTGNGEKRKRQ
jgi:hypothetical protein